ncbi:MAG: hypothetical protein ACXADC_03270 [Candidatus Thorarchaeota archaeon]|jgi:predicted transcriptional regulator
MNDEKDPILDALTAAGERGLLINELATSLGIKPKKLTKEIEQLVSKGLIKVQKLEQKEEKYVLKADFGEEADHGSLSDMNGCPCFHCLKISRCGIRQPDSPVSCREIEEWMISTEAN